MPGLVGILKSSPPLDLSRFEAMEQTLIHRSGYSIDRYADPGSGVAVSRIHLSILNPEPQPHRTRGGRLKVFLHGEIYNDDCPSDGQLAYVARLYERLGPGFAAELNGSFVALVLDEEQKRVVLANDRTASRPVFYFLDEDVLSFAPELKALLAVSIVGRKRDLQGLASFLACGFFLNGHTLIEGIRLLDGATTVTIERSGIRWHRYWKQRYEPPERAPRPSSLRGELAELLRTATRRRLRSDHRYGILLSGGVDSRAILGLYREARPGELVHTISWGSNETTPGTDCAVARQLSEKLGITHSFYPLRPERLPAHVRQFVYLTDGMTDACGNYPESTTIFDSIRADLGIDVLLRGDQAFGWGGGIFDERTMFRTLGINSLGDVRHHRSILREPFGSELCDASQLLLETVSSRCDARNIHDRKDFFFLDQRLKHYKYPLSYIKRLALEERTPFVDNDLLDFVGRLPRACRLEKRLFRETVTSLFPSLFDESAVRPDSIDWERQLRGSNDLRRFVEETITASAGALRAVLDPAGVPALAARLGDPRREERVRTGALRMLHSVPRLYTLGKRLYRWGRYRLGGDPPDVPPSTILLRLLTLALWEDLFP